MASPLTREDAIRLALADAGARAGAVAALGSASDETFPNSALGAPRPGEISLDVMTPGWKIRANAGGSAFVYRAGARQVRFVDADGTVHVIYPR